MKKSQLQKYAKLIARKGVNVQKGQDVRVRACPDQLDFVRMVVEECYKAGAGKVTVEWEYNPVTKATYKYCKLDVLSRADGENPVEAWNEHNKDIKERCNYLNSLKIKELKYKSSNGTDFRVGLIDGCNFLGGKEDTLEGIEYNPNIPSEEVFTSPMRGNADGKVVATRPLSYRGELIENFSVTFKDGKVVDVSAEKNEDLLRSMISMDEGAAYLGECALVPYDSPIRNSGITFYNTLFDENACCHLALGRGFNECLNGYANLSFDECKEKGINDSLIHVDFMIGSEDLEIEAVTRDGITVKIFEKGNWAF